MPITYDQSGVVYDQAAYTYNGDGYTPTIFPVAGIYIAFDDGPYEPSPTWTDVSQYVRSVTVRRGRADDFEQFDTGTAQLVLDNRERRFDPFYTSGPYYTKLTPRRQIRIVGQIGGSTYEVFRGYIAGWPVEWSEAGYDSTVTIQAFDALGLMANEVLPTDWPGYYTESLSPRHYWKCNDPRTTGQLVDTPAAGAPNLTANITGNLGFITPTAAQGLVGNSVFLQQGAISPSTEQTASPPSLTATAWLDFYPIAGMIGGIEYSQQGSVLTLFYNVTNGTFKLGVYNGTGYTDYSYALPTTNLPQFYAATMTANAGGTPTGTLYRNGVALSPTSTVSGSTTTFKREYMSFGQGAFQEIAVFNRVLTTTEITTIYAYGTSQLAETTTARMERLIGTTDYPAALQGFTGSPAASVSEIGTGRGVVPEMQLVADSEGGEIYVSKTGVLTTTNRTDVFNATRSANVQATITDSGVGIRYGTDVSIEYDGDNLKNDVTVTFSGDGEVNTYSDAVISAYGGSATTIETQLADPTSAAQLALVELGVEGSLVPRISPIDVSPNTAAADWQTILGLELLDRVTFKRTPTVGNQFSRDALINAIDHQIEPGIWRTQLTLSMRYTSPLTLDDDVLGTLDFNYLG